MSAYLVTAPAAEALSLADAKAFLRVEHGDDDAIIASLIVAARNHIEALTRCVLITQTWRLVLDRWPDGGRIVPRIGPVRSVVAARVFNAAGEASEIDPEIFVVDAAAGALAAPAWSLPIRGEALQVSSLISRPVTEQRTMFRRGCCSRSACWSRTGMKIAD
jgi:uncharacterized phiE125 gp8 family phage protein